MGHGHGAWGIGHWSLVMGHGALVIGHWSLVIGHWSLVIGCNTWLTKPFFLRRLRVFGDILVKKLGFYVLMRP